MVRDDFKIFVIKVSIYFDVRIRNGDQDHDGQHNYCQDNNHGQWHHKPGNYTVLAIQYATASCSNWGVKDSSAISTSCGFLDYFYRILCHKANVFFELRMNESERKLLFIQFIIHPKALIFMGCYSTLELRQEYDSKVTFTFI